MLPVSTESLEDVVQRFINLGYFDPHEIAARCEAELGGDLVELVRPYVAEFVAELARRRLGSMRRADVAKITERALADPELRLRSMWVPSADGELAYKKIGQMTAEDFEARAAYLEHQVAAVSRHAAWCREVAAVMRERGVALAGELQVFPALPALPVAELDA